MAYSKASRWLELQAAEVKAANRSDALVHPRRPDFGTLWRVARVEDVEYDCVHLEHGQVCRLLVEETRPTDSARWEVAHEGRKTNFMRASRVRKAHI